MQSRTCLVAPGCRLPSSPKSLNHNPGKGKPLFRSLHDDNTGGGQAGKAILVRQQALRPQDSAEPLRELDELARSAGAQVCDYVLSIRSRAVASTYIGRGKVEELGELVAHHNADLIIFDHAISPIQERNLERQVKCRVLDRSGLILDIFAQRATSREGKLQVEMAQLQHLSTRLVRGWTHLERQKGGIGLRGPGESQLETDRRLIGKRIRSLRTRLERLQSQRGLRRRARKRALLPTVSLVGYTNAGKSSLFRALTGENVLVEERLFATLDPIMRRLLLPGFGEIILSDTVGFIRDLPHTLIAAFKSTLEEVSNASCLLLVSDISDPDLDAIKAEVRSVLEETGAGDIPVINVYNKIDLIDESPHSRENADKIVDSVWLSATEKQGLDELLAAIGGLLGKDRRRRIILLVPWAGELRSKLYQKCDVLNETIEEGGGIRLELYMDSATLGWLRSRPRYTDLWKFADS